MEFFQKVKNLISNNQVKPRYNNTLAIRGMIPSSSKIDCKKNISLFLGSDFQYVIYPINSKWRFKFYSDNEI